jgi:Tol biopolymer transport system component
MPAGGGPARQLTDNPSPDWNPDWSPDGTRIKFMLVGSDGFELHVLDAAGGPAKRIVPDDPTLRFGVATTFVSDDTYLAWRRDRRLVVIREDGSLLRAYEAAPRPSAFSRITPDRSRVLYAVDGDAWVMEFESGESRRLTQLERRPGALNGIHGSDGESVWISWKQERSDLWIMDVDADG